MPIMTAEDAIDEYSADLFGSADIEDLTRDILDVVPPRDRGGGTPTATAAGAVWLAQQLGAGHETDRKTQQELADAVDRTPMSVRSSCKKLYEGLRETRADEPETTRAPLWLLWDAHSDEITF